MSEANAVAPNGVRAGDNVRRGILLSVVAVVVLGIQDAVSKILVQDYSSFQVVMIRYWAFAALSLFLALRQAPLRHALKSKVPLLQTLRGVLLMADIWLYALAIRTVPLAELQAISLVYPLLVTLLAVPLLGERVGPFRLIAVGVGFLGALVIVRPGGLPIDADVMFALGSALAYAVYITLTRKVSSQDPTATSMVYVGVVGLLLSSAVGILHWQPMDLRAWLLAIVLMVTMCTGHGLMMMALSMAPASLLQPFSYFSLPWGITLSFVVFGHLIDPISLLGAAVIVGAGLVVMARERRRSTHKPGPAEALGPRE
ncbi:MAG TPA: DMT family transporter [Devosiaceae bacterium]|jgi:drug/metabolite transporter (DMT)-like permease|nr:DMT family transporter [Devosiaceae bacterium]